MCSDDHKCSLLSVAFVFLEMYLVEKKYNVLLFSLQFQNQKQAWQEEVERARQGHRDAETKLSSLEACFF